MVTNLEIIFSCLQYSNLPREDQERFLGMCSTIGDGALTNIAATLRSHPEELPTLIKVMDMKWKALKNKDAEAFREALKVELAEIKKEDIPITP